MGEVGRWYTTQLEMLPLRNWAISKRNGRGAREARYFSGYRLTSILPMVLMLCYYWWCSCFDRNVWLQSPPSHQTSYVNLRASLCDSVSQLPFIRLFFKRQRKERRREEKKRKGKQGKGEERDADIPAPAIVMYATLSPQS